MKILKNLLFSATIITIFFLSAELLCRAFVFPGSYDYIERRIIENNLKQHKKPGEARIFLYGESTMHGGALYPYSTIAKWLELYLTDLLPESVMKNVTIVNFGRMGSDSTFTADAFIQTLAYKPDLVIFYMAHNDFCLTEYRPSVIAKKPILEKLEDIFGNLPKVSSFVNLINRSVIKAKIERNKKRDAILKAEDIWYPESDSPEAFKDKENLLPPGSKPLREIRERFEKNVMRIIRAAGRKDVPVIFFEGLARYKGYEPIVSPDGNALEYYRKAENYESAGDFAKANEYYKLANESDYFPIRAPLCVNTFYEKLRLRNIKGVDFVRTQELIEKYAPNGIVDETLTMDQIHPNPEGQAIMALELAKIISSRGLIANEERWRWDRSRTTEEMKRFLHLEQDSMFHIYTGTASYTAKHYREAAKALEKALAIRPASVFVRSWLAWTYWKLGEEEKAIVIYRELKRERPQDAEAFFKRHPDIDKRCADPSANLS